MTSRDKVAQKIAERFPDVPGQLAVDVPAGEDKPPPSCEHGKPRCHAQPARFYACGWKCDEHQPARTHRRKTP